MAPRRKKPNRDGEISRCNYCGKRISGMPHSCKFCGERHCDEHILPESHNCSGLKRGEGWKKDYVQRTNVGYEGSPINIVSKVLEPVAEVLSYKEPDKPKKKSTFKHRKKRKKIKFPFKSLILLIIIIATIYILFFNIPESVPSEEPLDYVNEYRISMGSQELIFSEDLSQVAQEISDQKQLDDKILSTHSELMAFITEKFNMSSISMTYVKIYPINGGDTSEFKTAFDDFESGKGLIKVPSYRWGAVECSRDYCTLLSFASEEVVLSGSLSSANNQDDNSAEPSKIVNKEDRLITKCRQSFESCKDIATQKYDMSISLLKIERFDEKDEAIEFFDTWKGILQSGLETQLRFEDWDATVESSLPLVIIASKVTGVGGQLPVTLICLEDGELTSMSKSQLLC